MTTDSGESLSILERDIAEVKADIQEIKGDLAASRQSLRLDLTELRQDIKTLLSQTAHQNGKIQDFTDWKKKADDRLVCVEATNNFTKGQILIAGSVATVVAGALAAIFIKLVTGY